MSESGRHGIEHSIVSSVRIVNLRSIFSKFRESRIAGLAYVAVQRLSQPSSARRAVFFPDQLYSGSAGDLRAVAIARELRSLGWRTVIVPPWLSLNDRKSIIRSEPNALLCFQQSRHPLNKPAMYPHNLAVFDADDADILNNPAQVIECLRGSTAVVAGSQFLADQFRPYNPEVTIVWTGTYVERSKAIPSRLATPTLVWAQGDPFDYPHEAALMLALWISLAEFNLKFEVAVYSQESNRVAEWLRPLTEIGIAHQVRPRMRYRKFIKSLSGATIGLQPVCPAFAYSRGKSFGKVLAYIVAGVPVVASDEVDHGRFFRNGENGFLAKTFADWVDACKLLLTAPGLGERLADQAYQDLGPQLSTRAAAKQISCVLNAVKLKSNCRSSFVPPTSVDASQSNGL
jgi:hypothetical protein